MRKKDKEIYEETDMIVLSEEEEGSKETTDVRKKKKKLPNWVIVPVIGGIVVVAVIASQFTSKEKKTGGTVEVVEVVRGDVKEIYNVSGTVDSSRSGKSTSRYSPGNKCHSVSNLAILCCCIGSYHVYLSLGSVSTIKKPLCNGL